MSLKKYNELTKEEQEKVKVMYSDLTTVEQYLYNFDKDKYLGRQYHPQGMTIHAEPLVEDEPKVKRTAKKK